MGRRSSQNAVAVRDKAAAQLRTMLARYDLGELEAQAHAADMVSILAGFAEDVTQPSEFRRQCANDVLDRAYGKPATKTTVEVVNPTLQDDTFMAELESAKVAAETFQQLDDLVRRRVPPAEWPDDVRRAAGDAIAFFEESVDSAGD